jgi:hypothetical protein
MAIMAVAAVTLIVRTPPLQHLSSLWPLSSISASRACTQHRAEGRRRSVCRSESQRAPRPLAALSTCFCSIANTHSQCECMHILQYLVFSDGRGAAVVPLDDVGDEEAGNLESLTEQGAEVDAPDGGLGEVHEEHHPEDDASFADEEPSMGDNGELEDGGGQVAEESVLPPWQQSGEGVDGCVPRSLSRFCPQPRVTALHTLHTAVCAELVEANCVELI